MDQMPKPDLAGDNSLGSADSEFVWRLVRGDEKMSVQAVPTGDATEYLVQLEPASGGPAETVSRKSFADEAEGQAYLQAELTRLVGEGWRRDRPELAAE